LVNKTQLTRKNASPKQWCQKLVTILASILNRSSNKMGSSDIVIARDSHCSKILCLFTN